MKLLIKLLLFSFFVLLNSQAFSASKKIALVIGINQYDFAPELSNPVNDANSIAVALKQSGFDVIQLTDVDSQTFKKNVAKFSEKTINSDVSLVYFAGHGIEVNGKTYLIPANVNLQSEKDLSSLIRVESLLKDVSHAHKLAVVILDACRNNPFTRSLSEAKNSTRSISVSRGLSRISDVPGNTLIAYSTQAGNVALDGVGANSPYAISILQHISAPNKDIRMVFGAVRDSTLALTGQKQEPFTYGSLGGKPLYLVEKINISKVDAKIKKTQIDVVLNPDLVIKKPIVGTKIEKNIAVSPDFIGWKTIQKQKDWTRIKNYTLNNKSAVYSIITSKLIEIKNSSPHINIKEAVLQLGRIRLDPSVLNKSEIRAIQRKLSAASFYGDEIDGHFGKSTKSGFLSFAANILNENRLTYGTLLVLSELADTENVSAQLSGKWSGRYYYPRPIKGIKSVAFEMNLILAQGKVNGYVTEPNTFGNKSSRNLYANFKGKIMGNSISWVKKYDGTGGISHSVRYRGKLDRKRRRINGIWSISSNWSGKFYIQLN